MTEAGPDAPAAGGPAPVPPLVRNVWLRLLLFLVVFMAVQVVGTLLALALLRTLRPDLLEEGFRRSDLVRRAPWIPAIACAFGIAVTLFLWRRVDRRSPAAIGLVPGPGVGRELLRGAGAAVGLMALASLPALAFNAGGIRLLPGGAGAFLANLALYGLFFALVAVNEELAFRGYLLANLLRRTGAPLAVVGSSVLFAAMHLHNPHLTPLGYLNLHLAGAFFALTVLKRGSLWFAIGCHFAWNLFLSVGLALPVSGVSLAGFISLPPGGPGWLTGGEFGPEGSVAATAVLALACLGTARAISGGRCSGSPG
jgi:uncharacterized protein